ncbi:MAG TPA: hypothetical protein VEI08_02545, partial [Candidatus Bathyarchaeia archaeon]|nr:hypothetical protein [Candidatus Bathyarchaeia archaeon]
MLMRALAIVMLLVSACGVALRANGSPANSGRDEGKNLTHAPYPLAPAIPGECNRECLYQFVDKYFDAMLSRCSCNLAVAPNAK